MEYNYDLEKAKERLIEEVTDAFKKKFKTEDLNIVATLATLAAEGFIMDLDISTKLWEKFRFDKSHAFAILEEDDSLEYFLINQMTEERMYAREDE